jgi:hypothetical protein
VAELGPGDKVLTLKDRLCGLERRIDLLTVLTGALVVLHLKELAPLAEFIGRAALVVGRTVAGPV